MLAAGTGFQAPPSDPTYATCAAPGSDEFTGATLDTATWSSSVNGPVNHTVTGGHLVLPTELVAPSTASLIQQPLPGSVWEATTKVTVAPVASYQQGGLILWENSSEWIVLDVYYSSGERRIQFNHSGSNPGYAVLPAATGDTFWFRMTADGTAFSGAYSTDGSTFTPIGTPATTGGSFAPTHIGPYAGRGTSSAGAEIDAEFDWFRFSPNATQLADCDGPMYEFCAAAGSDEFDGATLDTATWSSTVNAPVAHSFAAGHLVLPTELVSPATASLIQQPLPGSIWEATTKVTVEPVASYQQGGLILWENSSEWIVLDVYYSSGERRVQFNHSGSNAGYAVLSGGVGDTFWFRITADGNTYTGAYSTDGETFTPVGSTVSAGGSFGPTHVGPYAGRGTSSAGAEIDAEFDWFRFSPNATQLADCGYGTSTTPEDPYESAREKWRTILVGTAAIDPSIEPYASVIAALDTDASAYRDALDLAAETEPWADLSTSNQSDALAAFRRLTLMATAWATPGSAVYGDDDFRDDTITAFEWMLSHRYYDGMPQGSNWWFPEIGFPLEVNSIVVLLFDELSPATIDNAMDAVNDFSPWVSMTGANRVWKAMVVGVRGVIVEDAAKLNSARNGLSNVFDYVTSGDGFHRDGSFLQHNYYPYTGGYGVSLATNIGQLLLLLDDSPWEVVDSDVSHVYDWVTEAFDPVMRNGVMMDSVRGREISREHNQDDVSGATALRAMLTIAESAPAGTRDEIRGVVARHLDSGDNPGFWGGGSLFVLELADSATDGSVGAQLDGDWAFNAMARSVSHRGSYAAVVAMSNPRIATYESINQENYRSWYTADGMTYLYLDSDVDQYSDDFWATVNRYRLAGTTVDTVARTNTSGASSRPTGEFSGGAAGDAGHAAVAQMTLDAYGSDLEANKAWFFFDDEYVALGNGISATQSGNGWDGAPRRIETTIDNRRVDSGTVSLLVDGSPTALTDGVAASHAGADWAHLTSDGSTIGYVFPDGADIDVEREVRSGNWYSINQASGTATTRTNEFASLWFDHGTSPAAADYSYIVLPNASSASTSAYAASPDVRILESSSSVSAVDESSTGAVAAAFWASGSVIRDGSTYLTSDAIASVTIESDGGDTVITVVDPTQTNTGTISLELFVSSTATVSASAGATVTQLSPTTKITFDVSGARGKAFVVRVAP